MSSHSAAAAPVLRTERLSKSFQVPQPWPRARRGRCSLSTRSA